MVKLKDIAIEGIHIKVFLNTDKHIIVYPAQ
jgi:hypothetical protein